MAVKDLVSGVLAESITTSTTNVLVTIAENIGRPGILAFFPTPPFYITIMPKSPAVGVANRLDSEILQVTAVGNDQVGNAALTCVRGQRDTTAKAFEAGSIVTVGVYTDDAVLLGGTGTTETETPWITNDDIADNTIDPVKLDCSKQLVLVDSFKLTSNQNISQFQLTVPPSLVSKVEEAYFTFCMINASGVSEFIRFFGNHGSSGGSWSTHFIDHLGSASNNNTNNAACAFPNGENVMSTGWIKLFCGANTYQKCGSYFMTAADWFRTGECNINTPNTPGLQNITGVINNGSALTVKAGSWAKLYVRTS